MQKEKKALEITNSLKQRIKNIQNSKNIVCVAPDVGGVERARARKALSEMKKTIAAYNKASVAEAKAK